MYFKFHRFTSFSRGVANNPPHTDFYDVPLMLVRPRVLLLIEWVVNPAPCVLVTLSGLAVRDLVLCLRPATGVVFSLLFAPVVFGATSLWLRAA